MDCTLWFAAGCKLQYYANEGCKTCASLARTSLNFRHCCEEICRPSRNLSSADAHQRSVRTAASDAADVAAAALTISYRLRTYDE